MSTGATDHHRPPHLLRLSVAQRQAFSCKSKYPFFIPITDCLLLFFFWFFSFARTVVAAASHVTPIVVDDDDDDGDDDDDDALHQPATVHDTRAGTVPQLPDKAVLQVVSQNLDDNMLSPPAFPPAPNTTDSVTPPAPPPTPQQPKARRSQLFTPSQESKFKSNNLFCMYKYVLKFCRDTYRILCHTPLNFRTRSSHIGYAEGETSPFFPACIDCKGSYT